jgi:acetyl esterase/lipase
VTDPVGGPYEERHPDCPPVLWLGAEGTCSLFEGYLGRDPHDAPADVVPARRDLAGLPTTLLTTAEVDSLRPQAVRLVELLAGACVAVEVGDDPLADQALDRHVGWLREQLGR